MDASSITERTQAPEALRYALPASLSMATVETFASEIAQITLAPDQGLILDAAAVVQISTPGVQLLLSLAKTISRDGAALQLADPSQPLNDAFLQLGLGAELLAMGA